MMTIEERAFKAYPIDEEFRKGFEDLKENGVHNICVDDSFSKERYGYIKACEEYESLPKIHGWVVRHKNGELCLFSNKPEYKLALGWVDEHQHWRVINRKLFPEITIESEPVEVELLIRGV